MKKVLATLLPGFLLSSLLLSSVLAFGSGCVVRPGGRGHWHHHHGRRW